MGEENPKYVFVLQHRHPKFDLMPFSIARTWHDDKGLDLAMYVMYDAVELLRREVMEQNPDIREVVDYLLRQGVPIYACGFCSRACELTTDKYYSGIQIGNRHIFYSLMTERRTVYY